MKNGGLLWGNINFGGKLTSIFQKEAINTTICKLGHHFAQLLFYNLEITVENSNVHCGQILYGIMFGIIIYILLCIMYNAQEVLFTF